ncbi:MAG: winged helix-turn-helix transcriptional regulator [Veillonella sp.]|uniref:winged helix-turn-helix transcriptional regulator n=1 Tax=Veillonella sp. TaxID=1926307 RepID=UPI0025D57F1B|nr:winged helix-turn-helix transcriptional regulator [Veillonella sp.]MBS4913418.1 winged helix-turn-helix transcriptional regulator [Veillonella sp.]
MRNLYHLAIEATLEAITGKWKLSILCHLGHGTLRTGELRRLMPGISQRVLTLQLRELEDAGIITRTVYNEVPPRVEYSLSERGQSLRHILGQMSDWGADLIESRRAAGEIVEVTADEDEGLRI